MRRSLQVTAASASISRLAPGRRNRSLTCDPAGSGLIVRTLMPPLPRLSVSAAVMVSPNR